MPSKVTIEKDLKYRDYTICKYGELDEIGVFSVTLPELKQIVKLGSEIIKKKR